MVSLPGKVLHSNLTTIHLSKNSTCRALYEVIQLNVMGGVLEMLK